MDPGNYVPVLHEPAVGLTEDEYFDARWTTGSLIIQTMAAVPSIASSSLARPGARFGSTTVRRTVVCCPKPASETGTSAGSRRNLDDERGLRSASGWQPGR